MTAKNAHLYIERFNGRGVRATSAPTLLLDYGTQVLRDLHVKKRMMIFRTPILHYGRPIYSRACIKYLILEFQELFLFHYDYYDFFLLIIKRTILYEKLVEKF